MAPYGRDTYGSRSLAVGGVASTSRARRWWRRARRSRRTCSRPPRVTWSSRADASPWPALRTRTSPYSRSPGAAYLADDLPEGMEPLLQADHVFDPPNFTWPYGTHVCVVEVDTETGMVTIPKYVAVDDCGPVVNPAIVDGQLHGGIAQGIAQALYEEAVYDDEGNLVTGTMVDYMIPGAPEIPNMVLDRTETPSPTNPMGVKGIGESGAIAAQPAVINAVIDALSHEGVTHIDMPASP